MENGRKTDEEIQAEKDNPNTKALFVAPAAQNAYLLDKITVEFPEEIPSVINDESITLEGEMDIIKRRALVGLMIFPANDDPEMASKIDEFVELVKEADGDRLDYLASEAVQERFGVGKSKEEAIQ